MIKYNVAQATAQLADEVNRRTSIRERAASLASIQSLILAAAQRGEYKVVLKPYEPTDLVVGREYRTRKGYRGMTVVGAIPPEHHEHHMGYRYYAITRSQGSRITYTKTGRFTTRGEHGHDLLVDHNLTPELLEDLAMLGYRVTRPQGIPTIHWESNPR